MDCSTVRLARAEGRATLESDLSADAGGQTAGQGLRDSALFFPCPAGGPESDKLIAQRKHLFIAYPPSHFNNPMP
jgi:hypothetical protein